MVWYIKEVERKKFLNKIKVTDEGIVHVPVKDKVGKRALKKLNKLLRQNNISVVVLSEQLAKADILKDSLNENNVDMLEGRILFNHLIHNIVQYVAKKKDKKMETIEVSVMIDISNDLSVENIVLLAKNVKNLNIVTSNIQRFKRVETYLYEEVGILIKVSNNKRKALLKSDIIINIDFSEELINKYTIPNECVIINVNGSMNIRSKRFNGINVNNYKIKMPDEYRLDGFVDEAVYEGKFYPKDMRKVIKEDNIEVVRTNWK